MLNLLTRLTDKNLPNLNAEVMRPTYDRAKITPGIVHIGLGNFHRAHQAWYLHRLMQAGEAQDWGIIGAGVRPTDKAQRERLASQDYLTTLIELDPNGCSAEIIGSMVGFVPVEDNNASLIVQMAAPAIRIVSLTVTESGYYCDPVSQEFDASHDDILHDAQNPDQPLTAFGAIVAALKQRRMAGFAPFTCQSCDNLQGNGEILRQTVVSLARLTDADLAEWIEVNCTFPNSMVDCIVPATGEKELNLVKELNINDTAPVTHENFRQWVIEDNFCAGRPHWDHVGAIFTDNVHVFEAMKIRILNGGHQLIANAGEILSLETISDCINHPLIGDYFRKVAKTEISLQVEDAAGMTPMDYVDLIDQRFSNTEIIDTVRRVAFDGSSRQTGFVLPTLRDALKRGDSIEGLALSQAIWARMCEGNREDGTKIQPNDPLWDGLNTTAIAAKSNPQAWLDQNGLYGDLAKNTCFQQSFINWHGIIAQNGLEKALQEYLKG